MQTFIIFSPDWVNNAHISGDYMELSDCGRAVLIYKDGNLVASVPSATLIAIDTVIRVKE